MTNEELLKFYRNKLANIKRLNATNDDEWYETIHQYYPQLVEDILSTLEASFNREKELLLKIELLLESI